MHGHHTPKNTFGCRLPEVKIYDFRKSKIITESRLSKVKIITESRLLEVKNHHRKSTSGNQKSSPEVDFRKSTKITEVDFRI